MKDREGHRDRAPHRVAGQNRGSVAAQPGGDDVAVGLEPGTLVLAPSSTEAGQVDGADPGSEPLAQGWPDQLPVHGAPTEAVDQQDRRRVRVRVGRSPVHGVDPGAVGVEPAIVHRHGVSAVSPFRSSPNPTNRCSCSSIQTVWYESIRGEVNQSWSPSSTRLRAVRRCGR